MTYFKYAERQVDTQINWAEVGKSLSDTLNAEVAAREAKKEAIDQASREFAETLANAPTGLYEAGNQFASDIANDASAYRLMTDRLLKSGQLKLRDYTAGRQNINDDVSRLFDLAKEYQDEYKVKMDRWKAGESSYREVWDMEQAEGLANIRDVKGYINPATGNISLGKMVKNPKTGVMEMSKNPNDRATVNELRNRLKSKYDRYDVNEAAAERVEVLGVIEESIIQYAGEGSLNTIITKIDAKQGNYALDKDAQQFVADYKAWEDLQVESMMDIPYHIESVLTDMKNVAPNGKQYTFTYDRAEFEAQGEDGNLIFLDTSKDANGTPEFNERQRKAVEESMRIAIRAQIDVKKQAKAAGMTPYEPTEVTKGDALKDQQADVMSNIAALYYGDDTEVTAALSAIRGLNNNITSMKRTAKGIEFVIDGKVETFDFKRGNKLLTQREFVEGIANKLLTEKQKIQNFDEIAKRGKLDLNRDFNALSTGSDSVKEDKRLGFEETFDKHEGAKLNAQNFVPSGSQASDNPGPSVSNAAQTKAYNAMKSMVTQIPGAEGIKIIKSGLYGTRRIDVQIPDVGTFEINLKDKDGVAEQFEKAKAAIIGYARNQQSLLLDEDAKESYIDQYGVIKATGGELNE